MTAVIRPWRRAAYTERVEFIDGLREDHDLIERVAGAFLTFAATLPANGRAHEDGARFLHFFTAFAGDYHHAREEETLFPALVSRADLPVEGPIAALTAEHRRLGALLASARTGLARTTIETASLQQTIRDYVHGLWRHIDAENSVLLPESEGRLRKHNVQELEGRAPTADELSARGEAGQLIARYVPTMDDPAVVRGDGCVCCPLMTETCNGLEYAWWSEHEWDELDDHLGGD